MPINTGFSHIQNPIFFEEKIYIESGSRDSSSINKVFFYLCFFGHEFVKFDLIEIRGIKNSEYFFDQATPRFELGIKDLQSPALPLGHVAKTIQI